jgi:ion channel-forming bestrophin family protein
MFIHRHIKLSAILQFAWKMQAASFLLSLLVYILYEVLEITSIAIPFLPISTIGTAVAFYVGFKNNSAYDRLWEARRIWGSITNATRMWSVMVLDLVGSRGGDPSTVAAAKKQLIYRHLAWINMLRLQLRRFPMFDDENYKNSPQLAMIRKSHGAHNYEEQSENTLMNFLSDNERNEVRSKMNIASALLKNQNATIVELKNQKLIDDFEHSDMGKLLLEFYNQQGACERIKSFPFPRQYAIFSYIFVYIFVLLLPFGLIGELAKMNSEVTWLVIPFTMLIAWVFNVMEQVGDASENPFEHSINDIPMTTICRNLEIELREALGEKNLPPRIQPVNGVIV